MNSTKHRIKKLEEALSKVRIDKNKDIDILVGLGSEQQAFVLDDSKKRAACCTRRAGKSYSAALAAVRECRKEPNMRCIIIGKTNTSVRNIFWVPILKKINRDFFLGATFIDRRLEMIFSNGSEIFLVGADANEKEKEKLYGQKFKLVVIDEAEAFDTNIQELLEDVLGPAMIDYDGKMVMCGMPCNRAAGYFFDVTNETKLPDGSLKHKGWSLHRWSGLHNPFIAARFKAEMDRLIKESPGIEDTPGFQQMYLGRWVVDSNKLVYKMFDKNLFTELPMLLEGSWHYQMGIDLGWDDASSFVIGAYHDHDPCLYIMDCFKQSKMLISDVAEKIKYFEKIYPFYGPHVVDGANKQAVQEIVARHNIALIPSEKSDKNANIELMNDDFANNKLRIHKEKCKELQREWSKLVKKFRPDGTWFEHNGCENHLADAALYCWRYTYPYLNTLSPADQIKEQQRKAQASIEALRNPDYKKQAEDIFNRTVSDIQKQKEDPLGSLYDELFGGSDDFYL